MADRTKIAERVKRVGKVVIFAGTASLAKPLIHNGDEERSKFMKACAMSAGAVGSFGIASVASTYFNKLVDNVLEFVDDVIPRKEQKNG